MKKIEYWESNDGKKFETEQECYDYEHRHDSVLKTCVFFDRSNKRLTEDLIYCIEQCWSLYVPNAEAAELLHFAMLDAGYESPYGTRSNRQIEFKEGYFCYDDFWYSLDEEIDTLVAKREKLKAEAGLE